MQVPIGSECPSHHVAPIGPEALVDLIVITFISGICRWQQCVWSVFLNKGYAASFSSELVATKRRGHIEEEEEEEAGRAL